MFPESINELTVEQYQRYLKVDTENLTFQLLKASEIFLGIPLKVALSAQSDGFFNMMWANGNMLCLFRSTSNISP
jgi:hypothetical protein